MAIDPAQLRAVKEDTQSLLNIFLAVESSRGLQEAAAGPWRAAIERLTPTLKTWRGRCAREQRPFQLALRYISYQQHLQYIFSSLLDR